MKEVETIIKSTKGYIKITASAPHKEETENNTQKKEQSNDDGEGIIRVKVS